MSLGIEFSRVMNVIDYERAFSKIMQSLTVLLVKPADREDFQV